MRVCHIITRLIVGGAQENTLLTCAGLHARGHDVTLITGPDAGPEGELLTETQGAGYAVHVVPTLRRAIRPLTDWRARRDLAMLIRQIKPVVVHTHSSKAGIIGRLAAHDAGAPIIVHTIHGMSFNRTQPYAVRALYARLERRCARFTDRIITVADAMTAQAVGAGIAPGSKFVTVYSGMRTDWFNPQAVDRQAIRAAWGFKPDTIIAGTIARLFRNKGYEQLMPAMAQAAHREPRLRFVWVGDGAQREEYQNRLGELGIHGRVHLTGLIRPDEIPRMLAGMDMLVHASQWEGLPRAAVQALLMERPVISFNIDGAPEVVIPGETGSLVPLNDVRGLADAIVDLAADPQKRERYGQAGRQRCLVQFDHKRMVEQIEAIYMTLQARSGRTPYRPDGE